MTDYARLEDGVWTLVREGVGFTVKGGGSSSVLADPDLPNGPTQVLTYDLEVPANWLAEISTAAERAAFGLVEILPADSPPEGVETSAFEIIDHDGRPKYRAVPVLPAYRKGTTCLRAALASRQVRARKSRPTRSRKAGRKSTFSARR